MIHDDPPAGSAAHESDASISYLRQATDAEVMELLLAPSNDLSLVLVGYMTELCDQVALVNVGSIDATVERRAGAIEFGLRALTVSSRESGKNVELELSQTDFYVFRSELSPFKALFIVYGTSYSATRIDQVLPAIVMMAAIKGDWRLQRCWEWEDLCKRATDGELAPKLENPVPPALVWRLEGGRFTNNCDEPDLTWGLRKDGEPMGEALITVQTKVNGSLFRPIDRGVLRALNAPMGGATNLKTVPMPKRKGRSDVKLKLPEPAHYINPDAIVSDVSDVAPGAGAESVVVQFPGRPKNAAVN